MAPTTARTTARITAILLALLLVSAPTARAQINDDTVPDPEIGQAGKDVVWVPTPTELIGTMFKLAGLTANDYLVDLGSGDGRIVIAAAKLGATAMGVEYDQKLLAAARRGAAAAKVEGKATFVQGDMYHADFSKATVLALFLLPSNLEVLRDKFLAMPPGTRIVINTFEIPGWSPDKTEAVDFCDPWCTAHLWIVPANAAGTWRIGDSDLRLQQTYQVVSGDMTAGGRQVPAAGTLLGDQITFRVGDAEYSGRVTGDTMAGTVRSGAQDTSWSAARVR